MKLTNLHINNNKGLILRLLLVFLMMLAYLSSSTSTQKLDRIVTTVSHSDYVSIDLSPIEEQNDNALLSSGRTLKVVKKIVFSDKLFVILASLVEIFPQIFFDAFNVSIQAGIFSHLYLFHLF